MSFSGLVKKLFGFLGFLVFWKKAKSQQLSGFLLFGFLLRSGFTVGYNFDI